MPNIKSAKKRVLVSEKKAARNASAKSSLRTSVKKAKLAIAEKNENTAAVVKEACIDGDGGSDEWRYACSVDRGVPDRRIDRGI